MEIKPELPKFSRQDFKLNDWRLRTAGFIRTPPELEYNDLLALPKVGLTDDFTCLEGWMVKDIAWEGVKLADVLGLLGLRPETQFIRLGADDFNVVIPLARANEATTILALRKNGAPLDEYHGAPVRLVLHDQQCYESVKGLNRIEALENNDEGTAAGIALGRI